MDHLGTHIVNSNKSKGDLGFWWIQPVSVTVMANMVLPQSVVSESGPF